jgi:hypothetical protein
MMPASKAKGEKMSKPRSLIQLMSYAIIAHLFGKDLKEWEQGV